MASELAERAAALFPSDRIVYDADLRRPGCAIMQALGGAPSSVAQAFPTESWLLAPTPGMRVYRLKPGELAALIDITTEAMNEPKP